MGHTRGPSGALGRVPRINRRADAENGIHDPEVLVELNDGGCQGHPLSCSKLTI
jgi:hypothetical protein